MAAVAEDPLRSAYAGIPVRGDAVAELGRRRSVRGGRGRADQPGHGRVPVDGRTGFSGRRRRRRGRRARQHPRARCSAGCWWAWCRPSPLSQWAATIATSSCSRCCCCFCWCGPAGLFGSRDAAGASDAGAVPWHRDRAAGGGRGAVRRPLSRVSCCAQLAVLVIAVAQPQSARATSPECCRWPVPPSWVLGGYGVLVFLTLYGVPLIAVGAADDGRRVGCRMADGADRGAAQRDQPGDRDVRFHSDVSGVRPAGRRISRATATA